MSDGLSQSDTEFAECQQYYGYPCGKLIALLGRALAAEATADRYEVALTACLRGDLTLVMDGPTPGIGFDYSYVPATKEVMTTLAEVNRVLTGTEPGEAT